MPNADLRQRIMDELEFEPSVNATHIGVAVEDGIVTLAGHVTSYAEKLAAEHAVQRIKHVRGIAQEIQVRYPSAKKTEDDQIATRALAIIAWDTTVPDDGLQVRVQKGWVTLTGKVDWYFQKAAAEDAVRKLSGVVGVTNLIEVTPQVHVADVKIRIESALKCIAELEASNIRVNVSGGKVTLEGKVKAWHERSVAERAAWAVPGVSVVEDHLAVG